MPENARPPALMVWRFATAAGARDAAGSLEGLGVDLGNAAVISWARGTRTPRVSHLASGSTARHLNEAFWGLFFGLVFFMPLIGAATGGTTGTASKLLADVGLDDTFINKLRDRLTPGSSGLFVLVEPDTLPAFRDALPTSKRCEVLYTHLTVEQVVALRSVFGAA